MYNCQEQYSKSANKAKRKRKVILRTLLLLSIVAGIFLGGGKMISGIVSSFESRIYKEDKGSAKTDASPDSVKDQALTGSDEQSWNLMLVNPWNSLSDDFSVELETIEDGHSVDSRIASDLRDMLEAARDEGLNPVICSSYRTQEKQERLFSAKVDKYIAQGYPEKTAREKAARWVAVPGTSEHQTGLALDIVARNHTRLDKSQQDTDEQKWLMENSYKYGFILRYPVDKTELTGISFEPWHYRYVGKEAAKEIYDSGVCLEEYLESQR